jgi:hypothetical protein
MALIPFGQRRLLAEKYSKYNTTMPLLVVSNAFEPLEDFLIKKGEMRIIFPLDLKKEE